MAIKFSRALLSALFVACSASSFAGPVQDALNKSDDDYSRHMLSAGIGPSLVISRVIDNYGREYPNKMGFEFHAEYTYNFKKKWGVGAFYAYNNTSYYHDNIVQMYIGPEVTYTSYFSEHFIGRGVFSVGYGMTYDSVYSSSGVGFMLGYSLEYKLNEHLGISATLFEGANFGGNPTYDEGLSGIGRMALVASLCWHI